MNDDRKVVGTRDRELLAQRSNLCFARRKVIIKIQSDLSKSDHTRDRQQILEAFFELLSVQRCVVGMDTESCKFADGMFHPQTFDRSFEARFRGLAVYEQDLLYASLGSSIQYVCFFV